MVETITPVVHGGRGKWRVAIAVHVAGAVMTAAVFGALIGVLGAAVGGPFGTAGWIVVAAVALAYAAGAMRVLRVPVPALRRQVPDWWRTYFPPLVTAFLYGAGLGVGFLTYLATGGLVVVTVAAFASGSAAVGAVLLGAFGAARGLSALTARGVTTVEDGHALVDRLAARPERPRLLLAAISLLAVAAAAIAHAGQVPPPAAWAGPAAATVAITFAWAASAKLLAPAPWRRALITHDFPGWLHRRAVRGVPLAEAAVPALVVMGYQRLAAGWAAACLTVFALAIVRQRLRRDGAVACGCFGGRAERPAWVLLMRVSALAVAAFVVMTGPARPPVLRWPKLPQGAEVLPAALASIALVAAIVLAHQARRWLGGRA